MSNLWIYLSIYIFLILLGIGIIIHALITKGKEYIIKTIFCLIGIAFLVFDSTPTFQDAIEKETTIVIAECVRCESGIRGMQELYFTSDMGQISLRATSVVTLPVGKLEEGKTYEIEYYNNSKLIKSYRLIE